jgi:hypothetical protein
MSFLIVGGIVTAGIGIAKAVNQGKKQKQAKRKEAKARSEMGALKTAYSQISTTNPFLNMKNQFVGAENTFEDLTINQKQADFESQQFAQSQANIMSNLKTAAGGSGIASLAQSLARQGQLQAQQSSASIGAQESVNQRLAAQEAARLQTRELTQESNLQELERRGELISRQQQRDQTGTLLGMSQSETAAFADRAASHEKAKWDGIGLIGDGVKTALGGIGGK